MPYTAQHKLLSVFGSAFGVETWSFGIRFINDENTAATQTMADACRAPVSTWWATAGIFSPSSHILQGVKLADIAADGHYPPTSVSYIGDITDTAGGTSSNNHPAQCCMVATLLSATIPRGRGSKGRIYLPHPSVAISSAGRNGMHTAMANAIATMITSLNGVTGLGTAGILSPLGTGTTSAIGTVRCDDVPDTQRRRARQLASSRATAAVS